jgi:hypothetical protein
MKICSFHGRINESISFYFLGLYILLGLGLLSTFGISWDELDHRFFGIVNLNYLGNIFHINGIINDPILHKYSFVKFTDYGNQGVIEEILFVALERLLGIGNDGDERKIYFFRHLLTFLVNLVGVVAVYHLAKRRFNDWRIGLLAATFLVLSPRFFAESFYNSKDVVFMSFFALSTYTAISFILKPTWKNAIWHSLATAIAIDVRIMAIVIPAMTILMLGLRIARGEIPWRKTIAPAILYLSLAALVVVICWPWLWADPWGRFVEAFQKMSKFSRGPQELLYWGEVLKTANLPWHYIPVWIAITTPLLYVALFFVGIGATLKSLVQRHWRLWQGEAELQDLIFLGLFIVPILAVIVLHSTLYFGWRHLYFVYPAFLLLSIKGWMLLRSHSYTQPLLQKWAKPALTTILCISFAWTTVWMVRAHPLQNVYFNALAGKNWKSKFDVDYWGLSNRMALEYILAQENPAYINVWTWSYPKLNVSSRMLSPIDKVRIIELDKKAQGPDYIVNTYRMDTNDYAADGLYELIKDFQIGNETILSIFRSKQVPKPEVQLGKLIRFTPEGQGRAFIRLPGWSFIEPWGIWSDGKEGSLVFPLTPGLEGRSLQINLALRAFVTPAHPVQKVEIWANGNLLQTESFNQSDAKMVKVLVPATVNMQKELTLTLKYLNPISPRALGVGNDTRRLAVGIESATLDAL